MSIIYFDCFSGIAGDMAAAALLSLTGAEKELRKALKKMPLSGYRFAVEKGHSCGMAGTRVSVKMSGKPAHARHLPDIVELLKSCALPAQTLARAIRCFELLGASEAKVHGVSINKVHFHEVGAVDAIVDIVSGCFLFELCGAKSAYCSSLPGGSGEVRSAHGKIPVPAPATLELLKGAPWRLGEGEGELVTPTGAALLRAFDVSFERPPVMTTRAVGIGLGHRELHGRPNMLRVVLGEAAGASLSADRVLEIEANIDDMSPQRFELLIERAFEAGALDVAILSATMKKNRPGWVLRILAPQEKLESVSGAVFSISTAIGLRYHECDRLKLDRVVREVTTRFGRIRVKEATLPDGSVRPVPEYEDVKKIVRAGKATFDEAVFEAVKKWRR